MASTSGDLQKSIGQALVKSFVFLFQSIILNMLLLHKNKQTFGLSPRTLFVIGVLLLDFQYAISTLIEAAPFSFSQVPILLSLL